MSEIPKAYEPQSVESKWYQFWLDQQCFVADPSRVSDKRPAYSIVIPPPNVTGMLHMGHVLNNTIQDILSRKARMDGKEVLWLPGTDHAGIATEGMVDKQIRKEEKKSKRDLGREEFLKRVWVWKEKHGGIIIEQLKKLGCSCDWSRLRFTMDEDYVRCVQKVFVDLYKKGLIYRGKRMVNWCPATLTALSDEEVEMEPQNGFLWYFKVEVAESPLTPSLSPSGGGGARRAGEGDVSADAPVRDAEGRIWLTIATTRPETIPGDTAVAVHPKDPRYAALIGKSAIRPLPAELPREKKLIPIIADDQIDPEFGTGVLKVTPAHDKADFEIGQRHNLPAVDIMNPNATMNDLAGVDLRGLDRFEARKVAVEKLKEIGSLVKEVPYENKIGISQRARVPIEPRLSEQWFLRYPSVDKARECVEQEARSGFGGTGDSPVAVGNLPTGSEVPGKLPGTTGQWPVPPGEKMRFHPQRWAKVYDHWLRNIQDWCISRQLWWGHRIPVWTKTVEIVAGQPHGLGIVIAPLEQNGVALRVTVNGRNASAALVGLEPGDLVTASVATTEQALQTSLEKSGFTQDPDVLDTWASSWLWPFATMGWTGDPSLDSKNETLERFYPTTDLVTGPDIIFFWVARMIMAGYEYMGNLPFRNVYFTGIIRDKQGRKMSKTLGNSPDPLELIARYGADALRFGTMRSAPLGQDVLFDEKDVELGRNFCNKLWNACRFRQMQDQSAAGVPPAAHSPGQGPNFRLDTGSTFEVEGEIDPDLLTSDDKWILLKLDKAIREIDAAFAEYKFNEVTQTLYRFFWSEYCDWYVEASKAALSKPTPNPSQEGNRSTPPTSSGSGGSGSALHANKLAVIDFVLSHTLRLFHPFLPFITEELWHGLGYNGDLPKKQGGDTILVAHWPKPLDDDFKMHYGLAEGDEQFVDAKYEIVSRGRNLRREFNIPANKKVRFILKVKEPLPSVEADVIKLLLNAEALEVGPNFAPKKGTPSTLSDLGELFLPLEGLADVEAEKARLKKELVKIETEIEKVKSKLSNPDFVQKVPANVLEEHRKRLAEWQTKQQQVKSALDSLQG